MTVRLTARKRLWRLGHLQLALRVAEQRHLWLRHLVQSLLGRRHRWLLVPGLEGTQGGR